MTNESSIVKLADKTADLARKVAEEMRGLGVDELSRTGFTLVRYRTSAYNGAVAHVGLSSHLYGGDLTFSSIGSGEDDDGHYIHGDFHAFAKHATEEEILDFAESYKSIREELDDINGSREQRAAKVLEELGGEA